MRIEWAMEPLPLDFLCILGFLSLEDTDARYISFLKERDSNGNNGIFCKSILATVYYFGLAKEAYWYIMFVLAYIWVYNQKII